MFRSQINDTIPDFTSGGNQVGDMAEKRREGNFSETGDALKGDDEGLGDTVDEVLAG